MIVGGVNGSDCLSMLRVLLRWCPSTNLIERSLFAFLILVINCLSCVKVGRNILQKYITQRGSGVDDRGLCIQYVECPCDIVVVGVDGSD